MAAKKPSTARVCSSPVFAFFIRTPSTEVSPRISSTTVSVRKVILGFLRALSSMILDARNWSRRWIRRTSPAYLVRKSASSIAVSPPPTTATLFSLKKKPSQVAQPLTPRPMSRCSPSRPSHLAFAPVAIITDLASTGSSSPSAHSLKGAPGEVHTLNVIQEHLGPEAGRLGLQVVHHVRPRDTILVARVVFDVRGEHELAARLKALKHQRVQVRPGRVEGGRVPCRSGPDDNRIVDFVSQMYSHINV